MTLLIDFPDNPHGGNLRVLFGGRLESRLRGALSGITAGEGQVLFRSNEIAPEAQCIDEAFLLLYDVIGSNESGRILGNGRLVEDVSGKGYTRTSDLRDALERYTGPEYTVAETSFVRTVLPIVVGGHPPR